MPTFLNMFVIYFNADIRMTSMHRPTNEDEPKRDRINIIILQTLDSKKRGNRFIRMQTYKQSVLN